MLATQPGIRRPGHPLSDPWDRDECRGLQLDRRDSISSLSGRGARGTACLRWRERRGALQGSVNFLIPTVLDLQKNCTLFESLIVDQLLATTLSIGDRAERAMTGSFRLTTSTPLGVLPSWVAGFQPEEGSVATRIPSP